MILNCIAVDDEPLALGLVSRFIEQTPFLHLVGSYAGAIDALSAISSNNIDLVYLDIQMPGLNGLELARALNKGTKTPRIVFTTAFAQFSLESYKVDALDYLMKPFNYEEFLRTALKAHAYLELINRPIPDDTNAEPEHYLFLKVEYQLVRIATDDILYIEGLKDYIKVHLKNSEKSIMSLTSLKAMEEKLPSSKFMRVHRSYIVALEKISSMTKNSLHIGLQTITVGDQYKEAFSQFLKKWG
jgi:two-component system, LytTR family, response regulator LytT